MSIKWSSTTRIDRIPSGGIIVFILWVSLCSSFKGRLLCVGYVLSDLISVSSFGVVEMSVSVTRSSAFAITTRERHVFFSHQSILYSLDFFISNIYPTPAWGVPIVRQYMQSLVAFWWPCRLKSGCPEVSSALNRYSCSSEWRFFISWPKEANWTLVCSSS